jgi:hypothetical protein
MNNELQNLLRRTGSYKCSHFVFQKVTTNKSQKSCCGRSGGDSAVPVCSLVGQACPGLAMCPRLNVEIKSKLIESWLQDLKRNISPDPSSFFKS